MNRWWAREYAQAVATEARNADSDCTCVDDDAIYTGRGDPRCPVHGVNDSSGRDERA